MFKNEFRINSAKEPRRHIVTVLLHDYFHRHVFKRFIGEKQWSRFESRIEKNTDDICWLFDKFNIKATFFTLGWIAEKKPEIIKKLASKGHEIASAGYEICSIREMSPDQFRSDLRRAKKALENAGSNKIIGYRCAYKWLEKPDLWALDILADEGYLYDASYHPPKWGLKKDSSRFAVKLQRNGREIWEIPVSTCRILGFNLPVSGGNYLRQFPHRLMLREFRKWCRSTEAPFVLYFHPWELDTEQPRINSVGLVYKIKQYRNLGIMSQLLPVYFRSGEFQSVSQYLNVSLKYANDQGIPESIKHSIHEIGLDTPREGSTEPLEKVSILIPVFNEASSLPYLERTLNELIEGAKNKYALKFIVVDDASTDGTYVLAQKLFGSKDDFKILHHAVNKGIAGALFTGFQAADTEIVCSMDADCSYDPLELLKMIPLLEDGVDLVTASPYHRAGAVHNVPKWRLFLSKSLSRFYHLLLNHKLATYTSCFRVYRKSSVVNLDLQNTGFLGIAELIAKLDIHGGTIREHPTVLESRIFGQSKMQVLRTIIGHLKLLVIMLAYRRRVRAR